MYGSRDPVCRFDLNEREAIYRLFGRTYDSLGSLLDRITGGSGDRDPVDKYVMVLCARQLLKEPGRDYPEFWPADKDQLRILDHDFLKTAFVREKLMSQAPEDLTAFLERLDRWFPRRAEPLEAEA